MPYLLQKLARSRQRKDPWGWSECGYDPISPTSGNQRSGKVRKRPILINGLGSYTFGIVHASCVGPLRLSNRITDDRISRAIPPHEP